MFPLVYLQYDNTEDTFVNVRLCIHGPEFNLKGFYRMHQMFVELSFLNYNHVGLQKLLQNWKKYFDPTLKSGYRSKEVLSRPRMICYSYQA